MPAETTYVVFDEVPTWWYKEVSYQIQKNWSKRYDINLKEKDKEATPNQNKRYVKNTKSHTKEITSKEDNKSP